SCLSQGYWNDRERTERAFVLNHYHKDYDERIYRTGDLVKLSPDGNYVFLGRKDDQIKYMGYRIELGEIEAALQSLDSVNDVAAIGVTMEDKENPEIIAFVELDGTAPVDRIRKVLKARLPAYMQPHKIQVVTKIPRTENGKVDRVALKRNYLNSREQPGKNLGSNS
ncbi:MAG: peptide synthetase, partial [Candidatus Hodarchaeota archaeon]